MRAPGAGGQFQGFHQLTQFVSRVDVGNVHSFYADVTQVQQGKATREQFPKYHPFVETGCRPKTDAFGQPVAPDRLENLNATDRVAQSLFVELSVLQTIQETRFVGEPSTLPLILRAGFQLAG